MMESPKVLIPYDPKEAISLPTASKIVGKSEATVRGWCEKFHIGRRVVDGPWHISLIAMAALLDENEPALNAYLRGDRSGPEIAMYVSALNGEIRHPVISHEEVRRYQNRKKLQAA